LDDETLAVSKIFVESREAAMVESGDVRAAGHIFAEIGEVVSGNSNGRQNEKEITLFKIAGSGG
jgi:ornithine cyclodeaminase/alanine dehydrogenase-like protein (mu-crystallin family)